MFVQPREFCDVITRHKVVLTKKNKGDIKMKEYYLPDAQFGVEDSELYRSQLLAMIYELSK